jgi:hypothetical protein
MDGIERLRRAADGRSVSLPAARTDWAWYGGDGDDERRTGRGADRPAARLAVLRGQPLADFRAVAQDLGTRLQRVEDAVTRDDGWGVRSYREQTLTDVRRLRSEASQVVGRTYTSELASRTVADEVARMRREALSLDPTVRRFANASTEWDAAMTALDRLAAAVGASGSGTMGGGLGSSPGTDVFGRGRATAVSIRDVAEFRRLVRELDDQVERVSTMADRDYPGRRERLLGELEQLAVRADTLRRQTDAGTFDVAAIDDVVRRLQADARDVDQRMRGGRVFESTWNEWDRALQILEAMERLVQR